MIDEKEFIAKVTAAVLAGRLKSGVRDTALAKASAARYAEDVARKLPALFPPRKQMRLSSQDKRLIKATGGRCFYCGFPVISATKRDWVLINQKRTYAADHKNPVKRGGGDEDANKVCACWRCNSQKGALTVDEYRLVRRLRTRDLNAFFAMEEPISQRRDWICAHSEEFVGSIVSSSMPSNVRFKANWNVQR